MPGRTVASYPLGYDIDGDTDVAATLSAHGYGLAWYEQQADGFFEQHVIVSGEMPARR